MQRKVVSLGLEVPASRKGTAEIYIQCIRTLIMTCPKLRKVTVFKDMMQDSVVEYVECRLEEIKHEVKAETGRAVGFRLVGLTFGEIRRQRSLTAARALSLGWRNT